MITEVYLVVGSSRDYREWNVAAYHDKEAADLHCKLANERSSEVQREAYPYEHGENIDFSNQWDPVAGEWVIPDYRVVKVVVYLHPDDYQDRKPTTVEV